MITKDLQLIYSDILNNQSYELIKNNIESIIEKLTDSIDKNEEIIESVRESYDGGLYSEELIKKIYDGFNRFDQNEKQKLIDLMSKLIELRSEFL
jgi:hypothetical protein